MTSAANYPAGQGYRLPAEWEPHQATWIAWPHQRDDWPGKFEPIPWVYGEIVRHLTRSEPVRILVHDGESEKTARTVLERVGVDGTRVSFLPFATDRAWLRDSAAMFVKDGQGRRAVVDWRFNGWAKYDNWQHDDRLPEQITSHLGVKRFVPEKHGRRVVLEGGSIDVNGHGLLLTTEECLLSEVQARNPGLTRQDMEEVFRDWLGVERTLWLGRGIAGDDTHGHVDDLARFVGPRTVVAVVEDDPDDENFDVLRDNLDRLQELTDLAGRPLEVIALPMPAPRVFDGQRLPASYANFYIANTVVLVPTFNDPKDPVALLTLAKCFPDRAVVGIHAVDLVWGLGTLHCLTQQEPAP
jgi:agmatine deiminase